jgi:hypothetical protein
MLSLGSQAGSDSLAKPPDRWCIIALCSSGMACWDPVSRKEHSIATARHYIFGYGSLIDPGRRALSGESGEAIPVRVRGLERAWNVPVHRWQMTALGAVPRLEAVTNGVLIEVSESTLRLFDADEEGYTKEQLSDSSCGTYFGQDLPAGRKWVYIPQSTKLPTDECPIVQSYVDVVIAGCLAISEDFAIEFVRTTGNWDLPWINDRPRYRRAMKALSLVETIERILRPVRRTRKELAAAGAMP